MGVRERRVQGAVLGFSTFPFSFNVEVISLAPQVLAVWLQRHTDAGQHRVEAGGGDERVESLEALVQGFLYFDMWFNVADGTAGHGFCGSSEVWHYCGRCHDRQWQEEGRTECVGWSLGRWCGRAWLVCWCCRAGWRRGSLRVLRADGLFGSLLSARGQHKDWKYFVFDSMVLGLDIFALGNARTVRKPWEDGEDLEKWLENRFGGP